MLTISRRQALGVCSGLAVSALMPAISEAKTKSCPIDTALIPHDGNLAVEMQQGDPSLPCEQVVFDPTAVQNIVWGQTKASFAARRPNFANDIIAAAKQYVGKNRRDNRQDIAKFLALFDLPFDIKGKPLPFCAAGLSFVAATLYLGTPNSSPTLGELQSALGDIDHLHFYPSPSVEDMKNVAKGKRRWLNRADAVSRKIQPRPGWLVIYDWDKDGASNHVGLVEAASQKSLHTIEFNTSDTNWSNGGAIARRTRDYNDLVEGFVQTNLARIV